MTYQHQSMAPHPSQQQQPQPIRQPSKSKWSKLTRSKSVSGLRHTSSVSSTSSTSNGAGSTRAYWCTACDTKLARKFDWKRHMDEFHERYKKYPCPDCNRVFWGANTFNQHHRAAHGCTTCPHADRVVRYVRRKRAWGCGFCAALAPSLDRYLEHVALHYESGKTRAHWSHARVIYGLLHQPGVHEAWREVVRRRHGDLPRDQAPQFSWEAATTGSEQGFLEKEAPGRLQDFLEFFDPLTGDAEQLAELAYTQAIVLASSPSAVSPPQLQQPQPQQQYEPQAVVPKSTPAIARMSLPSTPQSKWVDAAAAAARQTVSVPQVPADERDMLQQALQPIQEESMFEVPIGLVKINATAPPPTTNYLGCDFPDPLLSGLDMSFNDWSSMVSTVVDDSYNLDMCANSGAGCGGAQDWPDAMCIDPPGHLEQYYATVKDQYS